MIHHWSCAASLACLLWLTSGCVSTETAARVEQRAAERSSLRGQTAYDFTLMNQVGEPVSLYEHWGEWIVLYFFPEIGPLDCDCTYEKYAQGHKPFEALGVQVFGVGIESPEKHRAFMEQFGLSVELLSDPDGSVVDVYGAYVPGAMQTVRPGTVLIDPHGQIAYHWPRAIHPGHVGRVQETLAMSQATWASRE